MFVNLNALTPITYIGANTYAVMPSPFVVVEKTIALSFFSQNGLPSIDANITGNTVDDAYYLLDFGETHTIVWALDCEHTGFGNYASDSCDTAPTKLEMGFNATLTKDPEVGTFFKMPYGGYVVSGHIYETDICVGDVNCKIIEVYSGEDISNDNWHFNEAGHYGIIGMGPYSYIWESYI